MDNKYNTSLKSRILELQGKYLSIKLKQEIEAAETKEEIDSIITEYLQNYYVNLGRPLMQKRYPYDDNLPYIEDYNKTTEEIAVDTSILFDEIGIIGDALSNYFNHAQSERNRIRNRINKLTSSVNDLNLIAHENTGNSVYFKDSFNDYEKVESNMIVGTPADISTQEGVVTLKKNGVTNRSTDAQIRLLQGDGEKGNAHVVKRVSNENSEQSLVYLSDMMPNDQEEVLLDGRPDTIFEYQTVNVEREDILHVAKGYDFTWIDGKRYGDRLRLRFIIELKERSDINWININPYYAPNSTGKMTVYSIRTSEDGFEYQSLYSDGNYVLNAELNLNPQSYREDEIFTGDNDPKSSKFAGQGVWSFPIRKAKYVEVVIDQHESYDELIGHTYYERITIKQDPNTGQEIETRLRVPASEVPERIVSGGFGRHSVGENEFIEKSLEAFNGWRYAIGLRDVNIMSHQYEKKSEVISKKFTVDRPIKQVMLYANEKLPQEFLGIIERNNDWIQYYISYDDVNWHRISPMHHQPVSSDFPAKIYEFNPSSIELESSLKLYKTYIETEEPVEEIRLKAIIQRPEGENMEFLTPILEEYALRLVLEDTN